MWVAMIIKASPKRNLLLAFLTYNVFTQTLMVIGSNVDSTSTMNTVDKSHRITQGRFLSSCGPSTEKHSSVGHGITTSSDGTTPQLKLTKTLHCLQTSFNVAIGVTDVNAHSSVSETLVPFDGVDDTTRSNKMSTVQTQRAVDDSQNETTLTFSESDITRAELFTDVYQNSIDVNRLLKNGSWEFNHQSNATQRGTVGTTVNVTVLYVKEDFWQERLSVMLLTYVPPFLITFGTLGNAVSVITFQHRNFRFTSTGFILTALSAVDIASMNVSLIPYWLISALEIDFENISSFGCKCVYFLVYYLHTLASWTLILLTVERGISVCYPFRCKELCSKRRIVVTWVIIALCLLAENSIFFRAVDQLPTILYSGTNNVSTVGYSCRPVNNYFNHLIYGKWAIVDAFIGDVIPFLVILTGNTLIITRIVKSHWERKSEMGVASTTKPMTSTTVRLIGLSAMFIIFNSPYDITYFYYFNVDRASLHQREMAIYNLADCISLLSYNVNSALEFIVYFAGGRKFREAFLETFVPCRKANNLNGRELTSGAVQPQQLHRL